MADHKQRSANLRGDALDSELDAALAKYVAAEPRSGIEERLLANLRTERKRLAGPSLCDWCVAAALAIVVVALAWILEKPSRSVTENHPSSATQDMQTPTKSVVSNGGARDVPPIAPNPATRRAAHQNRHEPAAAPKLDQFPSPRPLSEQEKILADYVMHFHHQAVLVARARNEELERDRITMIGTAEVANGTNQTTSR